MSTAPIPTRQDAPSAADISEAVVAPLSNLLRTAAPRVIDGDVGTDHGDLRHDGDLRIAGSVCAGVAIQVAGDLRVEGSIETATIVAGGSVTANGGIVGRGKGRCTSGGSVSVRSANATTIEAAQNIEIAVEIANCRVISGGMVKCEGTHIYGGHITANGGVHCETLGSPGGSETLVEIGIDESLRRLSDRHAIAIGETRQRTQRIRDQIEPLLAQQKALTPQQKETATELLYTADDLDKKNKSLIADLRHQIGMSWSRSRPEVVVTGTLHPGVVIRCSTLETRIDRAIKGPVKIFCEGKGPGAKLLLVDLRDNSSQSVKCCGFSDDRLTSLFRAVILALPKEELQAKSA